MGWRIAALSVILLVILNAFIGCSLPPEGSPEWYFNQADELASQGRYEEAIEEYSKVIEANATTTTKVKAYTNRAAAYLALECYDEAIADYTEAIALDSERTSAYTGRAAAYYAKGEYEITIIDCIRAISIDPHNTYAYFNRGLAYKELGMNIEAISDFEESIALTDNQQLRERATHEIEELSGEEIGEAD
ncbi:MAG: tetratricopeptide repeat protein [Dehalococcoidales bacterium]|nr:MAG: tetratricopeptide repeat protein [Dehalococcoidales bacterium]